MSIFLNTFVDILRALLISLSILCIPIFVVGILTCPTIDSFDAKKELKRCYRGQHLPDDHPDKPKGWFAETAARFTAVVATEVASGLGYEVKHVPILGLAIFTTVTLNSVNMECYWIGAFNKWYFIMQRKLEGKSKMASTNLSFLAQIQV